MPFLCCTCSEVAFYSKVQFFIFQRTIFTWQPIDVWLGVHQTDDQRGAKARRLLITSREIKALGRGRSSVPANPRPDCHRPSWKTGITDFFFRQYCISSPEYFCPHPMRLWAGVSKLNLSSFWLETLYSSKDCRQLQKAGEKPGSIIADFLSVMLPASCFWTGTGSCFLVLPMSFLSFLSKNTWPEQYSYGSRRNQKDRQEHVSFSNQNVLTLFLKYDSRAFKLLLCRKVELKNGRNHQKKKQVGKTQEPWQSDRGLIIADRKRKTKHTHTNRINTNSGYTNATIFNNSSREKLHFAKSAPAGNHSITAGKMLLFI